MEKILGVDLGGLLDKGLVLVVVAIVALAVQRVVVRLMHRALDASNLPSASISSSTSCVRSSGPSRS